MHLDYNHLSSSYRINHFRLAPLYYEIHSPQRYLWIEIETDLLDLNYPENTHCFWLGLLQWLVEPEKFGQKDHWTIEILVDRYHNRDF